jgi:hypothetical protein
MEAHIEIDGKQLTSIREASGEVSYSRDYVTRLAREGKIVASLIGRQWFVDSESLKNYAAQAQMEAESRKALLSEERKNEQLFHKEKERLASEQTKKYSQLHKKAILVATFVLSFGLSSGAGGHAGFLPQLASLSSGVSSTQATQSGVDASAASEKIIFQENPSPATPSIFADRKVTSFEPGQNGVLIIPSSATSSVSEVFSDEVEIRTASSGEQTAVLIDSDGEGSSREVPFVIVPVKTVQN